jgi:hypothetical protein
MGHRTTISGHIQELWYVNANERQNRWLLESNSRVIDSLPIEDDFPPLSRRMFSFSPLSPSGRGELLTSTYRGRVIYFGGSFSSIFDGWEEWLTKFENLLRRLYWEHAAVVLITEYLGNYFYHWDAFVPDYDFISRPEPIQKWRFTGEPRSFDV